MSAPQKARNAGERRWNERSQHFFSFNYCYYYENTKREPLRRREARSTRKRNAKWLGCGRSGLALFAGSHRSPLEENSSLEPTLCQGVAVPSAFFVFSPGGRVRPRTLIYLLSTPLLWVFTQNPIPISVSDQNNFIFNILLSWISISGHFGVSSDKDDRLIAVLGYPKFSKKVLRLGYPRADVPGYTLKGVYYHAQIEERVSMVDKKKVDSLLLIPQSPLAVEDLNMSCSLCWNWTSIWSIAVLQPTP